MDIAFSIILVSRSRPEMLDGLIKSMRKTCVLRNEIIVGLDLDDDETISSLAMKQISSLNDETGDIMFTIQKRDANLHTYINNICKLSRGEYIFVLNDDCVLLNEGWDEQAKKVLDDFDDSICYGRTYDDSVDRISNDYSAFPIMSKASVETLGFCMDETFGNHGSDVITYRIFNEARKVVDLPMVKISHLYHNTQTALLLRQEDDTAVEMIQRTFSSGFDANSLFTIDVSDKVERLKNA
jgi:glycosyltransferase involved in cell wall biosynthesis